MKKRLITVILAAVLLLSLLPVSAVAANSWGGEIAATFSGGLGTEKDPYRISTAAQLAYLSLSVTNGASYKGKYIVLEADIDLAGKLWTPIGSMSAPFEGTFNGGFHKISNINVNQTAVSYTGLFGYNTGEIRNLILDSGTVSGYRYTGGIVGYNSGKLRNLDNGAAVSGSYCTAGIVGYSSGEIRGCSNRGRVLGTDYTAGIVGYNYFGTQDNLISSGTIQDCYNTGYISGMNYSGGIAAALMGEGGSLKNAYSSGIVVGNKNCAAIAGYNNRAEIRNCYYLSGSSATGLVDSTEGVEAKTQILMRAEYFRNQLDNQALWSRNDNINDGFPCFKWQNPDDEYDESEYLHLTYVKPSDGFAKGSGTAANPYVITSAGELEYLARSVAAGNTYEDHTFVLDENIRINDSNKLYVSTPIGTKDTPFLGDFDGAGHYIAGLYIPFETEYPTEGTVNDYMYMNIALFGNNGGHISDLAVVEAEVSGYYYVGILAGQNSGTIERCFTTGELKGNMSVGGIAGQNSGTVQNCYNTAKVSGIYDTGGIVGENSAALVYSCYNTGTISALAKDASGIAAVVGRSIRGSVENCYYYRNTASVGVTGINDNTQVKSAAQFLASGMLKLINDYDEMTRTDNGIWVVKEGVNIGYPTFSWAVVRPQYVFNTQADDGTSSFPPVQPDLPDPPATPEIPEYYYDWTDEATDIPDRQAIALPSTHRVTVNGKQIDFDIYNIGGNNYFKLRDVAYVLNGTEKQFEVQWLASDNSIHLTTNQPYTPDGYEMIGKGAGSKLATPTLSTVYLKDRQTSMIAYFIEDNNYFKIRDLAKRLGFDVSWDNDTGTVVIDTSITYIDDEPH